MAAAHSWSTECSKVMPSRTYDTRFIIRCCFDKQDEAVGGILLRNMVHAITKRKLGGDVLHTPAGIT